MKKIFLCFISFFYSFCFYSNVNSQKEEAVIEKIEIYIDSSKHKSIQDIVKEPHFKLTKNGYPIPNDTKDYWFKLKLKSNLSTPKIFHLALFSSYHFDLKCYYFIGDSLVLQKTGLMNKNVISHRNSNPNFEIEIPAKQSIEVYIKYKSYASATVCNFEIMSEKTFDQDQQKRQFTYGIYYGILILILIINIFYYLTLKKKVFLFYSIYIFLTLFFCSYMDGIPLLGFLNPIGESHKFWLFTSILLYVGFIPVMSVYYLQLENNKKLLKISYYYFFFTVLSSLLIFVLNDNSFLEMSYLYHNITILFGLILVVIITIKGVRTNKILGKSYLIAMIVVVVALIISGISSYGLNDIGFDLIKLGSLIEMIILSLALALFFKNINKELIVMNSNFDSLSDNYKVKESQLFKLEDRFLSSQMNPHFTFNAMNSILHYMLENESENAQNYLIKYSRLIRKVMENNLNEYVSLEDEIQMLRLYLDMEKLRLSNRFEFEINFAEDLSLNNCFIPPMLIQPFVENAVWHGISLKKEGEGKIQLFFELNDEHIKCIIEDNGVGREKANQLKHNHKQHHSFGIEITEQRLKTSELKTKIYDLKDEKNNPIGTRVEIYLPLRKE